MTEWNGEASSQNSLRDALYFVPEAPGYSRTKRKCGANGIRTFLVAMVGNKVRAVSSNVYCKVL